MPFTVKYDHPDHGSRTHTNVTKLEGVWFRDHGRTPTHYAIYVGKEPYEHHRLPYLVPNKHITSIKVTRTEGEEYLDGDYTDEVSPEERRDR